MEYTKEKRAEIDACKGWWESPAGREAIRKSRLNHDKYITI